MDKGRQTVLVVDDQEVNRQILRHMLEDEYAVVEAENGADALKIIKQSRSVEAIVLDIMMPVMDGYAFLSVLKELSLTSLPVIAVTATKDEAAEQKALDLGAWDFISKPYHASVLRARLKNVIVRSQFYLVNEMRHVYEHDSLTDLYNRVGFFSETRRVLLNYPDKKFAILRFDIDNFHLLNAFWGEEEGNRFLCFVADGIRKIVGSLSPCVYGRVNADTFGLCMEYDPAFIQNALEKACKAIAAYNVNYLIEPSLGVYAVEDPTERIEAMYEKATLAARECKGKYETYLSYYDPAMSEKVLREQSIISEMQTALDDGQFEVYLQPKYNLENEKPYGAEALIRWRHPEKGMILPGTFIPIFERNGFIGKVDRYMWEKVCILLRKWLDAGEMPAPVSVNVSRVNMYNPNLVGVLTALVRKYQIPPHLINLELTESAYMDDPELMSKTVRELQAAGFIIMMDDFGSGYSSLNTLKDIQVNILKIDMKFLSGRDSSGRNECILASVVRMAGWLNIPVIMEGVETAKQVEFLKSIGCGYVQGYYYAKPMPVREYEQLVSGKKLEPAHSHSSNHDAIFQTVWVNSPQLDLLFDSIRQPIGIYEVTGNTFCALRVNAAFNLTFGYGSVTQEAADCAGKNMEPEELQTLTAAFMAAAKQQGNAACSYRTSQGAAKERTIHVEMQYWGANEKSAVIFAAFSAAEKENKGASA